MRWLYRLQQHLSLTGPESTVLLTLMGLLAVGLGVREAQERQVPPFDATFYAAADARFVAQAALPLAETPVALATLPLTTELAPVDTGRTRTRRSTASAGDQGPVRMNINTANARLLERLPGVGPAMAERIIAYRTEHGPFRRPQDLVNVRGIGDKTFARMEPYVFVEAADAAPEAVAAAP